MSPLSTETEDTVGERPAPPARRAAVLVLLATAAVSVLIDQVTKHLALANLDDDESVRTLGGLVYLSLTRNSGAAFSLGSDYTFVFPLITCGVIAWIAWMALRLRSVMVVETMIGSRHPYAGFGSRSRSAGSPASDTHP